MSTGCHEWAHHAPGPTLHRQRGAPETSEGFALRSWSTTRRYRLTTTSGKSYALWPPNRPGSTGRSVDTMAAAAEFTRDHRDWFRAMADLGPSAVRGHKQRHDGQAPPAPASTRVWPWSRWLKLWTSSAVTGVLRKGCTAACARQRPDRDDHSMPTA